MTLKTHQQPSPIKDTIKVIGLFLVLGTTAVFERNNERKSEDQREIEAMKIQAAEMKAGMLPPNSNIFLRLAIYFDVHTALNDLDQYSWLGSSHPYIPPLRPSPSNTMNPSYNQTETPVRASLRDAQPD
jgi:hypothetical protein